VFLCERYHFRIGLFHAFLSDFYRPFRNALDKSDRKRFDEMFDLPRLYTSACSYAAIPVRLYPLLMSILLYNFQELTRCISEVERIEARLNRKNNGGLTREYEEQQPPKPTNSSSIAARTTTKTVKVIRILKFLIEIHS
jgi:hypothetical protein